MLDPSGSDGCGIYDSLSFSSSDRSVMGRLLLSWGLSVQAVEAAAEHQAGQLAVAGHRAQPGQLAGVVAPGLVAGEQHPVVPDPAPAYLVHQPARGEPDGPGQVGVDALASGDPVEEPATGELHVAAHAAAEMH